MPRSRATDRLSGGTARRLASLATATVVTLAAVFSGPADSRIAQAQSPTDRKPSIPLSPIPPKTTTIEPRTVAASSVGASGAGVGQGFWTPPAVVSAISGPTTNPSIAVDRALNIQVLWGEIGGANTGGLSSFVEWSQKGPGGEWTAQTPINTRDTDPYKLVTRVVADSERSIYHAVWGTCDLSGPDQPSPGTPIYYANRVFTSATWNIPVQVVQAANCPSMAIDSQNNIHIVYEIPIGQPNGGTIAYFTIPLGGFPTDPKAITTGFGDSHHPSVFVSRDGTVHVAWSEYLHRDNGTINSEIYYNWKEAGNTWNLGGWRNISNNDGRSDWPVMATDLFSALSIVWQDETYCPQESYDIVGRYRAARGDFTDIADLSNMCNIQGQVPKRSTRPSIAIDILGNVHIVWQAAILGNDYDSDIYYAFKPFNGAWAAPRNISNNPGSSIDPYIAVDPLQRPHVVWADGQLGGGYLPFYAFDAPKLGLSQTSLVYLLGTTQTSASPQSLQIRNDGDGDMYWTATADQAWIQLTTALADTVGTSKSGIVKLGDAGATLTVAVDPTKAVSGTTLTGTITVQGDSGNAVDGTQQVTVAVYRGEWQRTYLPIVMSQSQAGW